MRIVDTAAMEFPKIGRYVTARLEQPTGSPSGFMATIWGGEYDGERVHVLHRRAHPSLEHRLAVIRLYDRQAPFREREGVPATRFITEASSPTDLRMDRAVIMGAWKGMRRPPTLSGLARVYDFGPFTNVLYTDGDLTGEIMKEGFEQKRTRDRELPLAEAVAWYLDRRNRRSRHNGRPFNQFSPQMLVVPEENCKPRIADIIRSHGYAVLIAAPQASHNAHER